jgi:outer membrane receptor for ferrienterochelin and colicins
MTGHLRATTIAGVGLALAIGRTARAGEDLSALLSEPVETTAAKSAGTAAAAPALSVSISAEDLRRHGVHTLAEAYNFLALGLVSADSLGEPEVGGRGLLFADDENKHLLLLIDGHSTNNQESGASLHGRSLGLPIELIDHIEIVLGPGSVLYGSNAMLGVVNVVTKRAKDFSGLHVIVEGGASPPIDRAHDVRSPALTSSYLQDVGKEYRFALGGGREFTLRGLPAEVTGQIEYYNLDGPAMMWGPQSRPNVNTGPYGTRGIWGGKTTRSYYAQIPSGYGRLVVGDFEATIHLSSSRVSRPYPKRTDVFNSEDFDDPDSPTLRRHAGVDLQWRRNLSTVTSMSTRVYGDLSTSGTRSHDHPYFGCLDRRMEVACEYTQDGYARSVGAESQWTFDWGGHGHMTTLLGADGRLRRVGYQNGANEVGTGQQVVYSLFNDTQVLGAVYAQHVYHPSRAWTLNAGARLDADSRFGSRLVPRAAIVVEPWWGGTLKTIYAQAFRAPTPDEVNSRNPTTAIQAQGLRPEGVRSIEGVLQQRFGAQRLLFGVFRSQWTDMIVRREFHAFTGQINDEGNQLIQAARRDGRVVTTTEVATQYQNVPSIENFGVNGGFEGSVARGRLAYGLNVTTGYARLQLPTGNQRITVSPSLFGNARVSFDFAGRLPVVGLAAHFSDRRLSDAGDFSGFVPLPYAPASLDLRGTAAGPFPRVKRLSYRVLGNYAFESSAPYTAGLKSLNARYMPQPELIPTVRFTLMFLLEYALARRP